MSYGKHSCEYCFCMIDRIVASPYLLSLGLSRSKMAVVFAAGPVSGLVMQPLIGA